MIHWPDYWLERPSTTFTAQDADRVLAQWSIAGAASPHASTLNPSDEVRREQGGGSTSGVRLLSRPQNVPLWFVLCHLAESGRIALHGSSSGSITEFEPRHPHDENEFGNRRAVFAAGDGIWPLFHALLDRERFPHLSMNNGCVHPEGDPGRARYVFSVDASLLPRQPWSDGFVYLLPRDGFEEEPPVDSGGFKIRIPHLANPRPVRPIGRVRVVLEDFPLLGGVRGHDPKRMPEYAAAVRGLKPWPA